jgi:hypothetical protein
MENNQQFREGESAPAIGSPKSDALETKVPESLMEGTKKSKSKSPDDIFKSLGRICVRPYTDGNANNMGLENYGFAVFPGTAQEEQLAAIERNGITRYISGLDEFAPEVQKISDPEKKEAVIFKIRSIVSDLEKQLAANVIDPEDKDFWSKVQVLKPNNHEFFAKINMRCSNEPVYLNPKNDPMDLIKFIAIEAGGFDLIAKSYEDARAMMKPPKWYLDKEVDTVAARTEGKKLKNKATSILESLFNKSPKKLFYVAKVLEGRLATQFKHSTAPDTLYDVLDEYINGNGVETNKVRAAQTFIDTSKLDMETLKLKALVKDASFYNIVVSKPDGMLYHSKTSSMLGRNVLDVVEYLKNPLNEDVLVHVMDEVESYWNN